MLYVVDVVFDAFGFEIDIKSALQIRVVSGDTDRAGIAAALHCLNATSGEHVAASGANDIGSETKGDHLATGAYQFSRSD